jgi:hypothetical protein
MDNKMNNFINNSIDNSQIENNSIDNSQIENNLTDNTNDNNKRKNISELTYKSNKRCKVNINIDIQIHFNIDIKIVIKLQSFFRKKLSYFKYIKLFDIFSQTIKNKEFSNDSTLIGTSFQNIKKKYRYILNDNNTYYFFDIRELYNNLKINKKNPYTNNIINIRYQNQIDRICNKLIQSGNKLNLKNPIPKESKNTVLITEFLTKLHKNDVYTTIDQLNKLQDIDLFTIISKLILHFNCSETINTIYNNFLLSDINILLYFIKTVNNIFNLNPDKNDIIAIKIADLINLLSSEIEYEESFDIIYYVNNFRYIEDNSSE